MTKLPSFTSIGILILSTHAIAGEGKLVEIKPFDCGPLAREEFGIVFSAIDQNVKQAYFVKGKATELCPIILKNTTLTGYEFNLCRNYKPENPFECGTIKEFVLIEKQ